MIIEGKLSLSQQKKGRQGLLLFSFLNGISLTFVTGNVMSLYLLQLGLSIPGIAICASFAYIGALFVFTGKKSISKLGASSTLRLNWILCGIFVILLALIPFFFVQGNSAPKMIYIILITFLFFVFKQIGTASTQPLMGEFTNKENQGRFSSKYFFIYNIATIIAILGLVFLMNVHVPLFLFQIAIILGGIIFIFNSFIFLFMKETTTPSLSAKNTETKKLFSTIWKNSEYRNFLILKSTARAGMVLIIPISILALKKLYNVHDQTALTFTCVQLVGGMAINYLNGIISRFTGPKPLILLYLLGLFTICALWILAPYVFIWEYCMLIFFLGGICLYGLDSSLNHYYLSIIPKENSVGISLWFTTIGGAVVGISGLLFGGALIDYFTDTVIHSNIFRYYYLTMFILLIPVLFFALKLKNNSNWGLKDVINLLLNPSEMRNARALQHINKYSSASQELADVLKLHGMGSNLSEESLVYYLSSPIYFVRLSALRAINNLTIGKKTKEAVYEELKNGDDSIAYLAAIIFARNPYPKAIPLLREYLDSKDSHLLGNSMIALAAMNDTESFEQIIEIFRKTMHPRVIVNGVMALSIINDINTLGYLLEKLVAFHDFKTQYIKDEIIWTIARLFDFQGSYYKCFRIFQDDIEIGFLNTIEIIDKNKISNFKGSPEAILKLCVNLNQGCSRFMLHNLLKRGLKQNINEKGYKILYDFLVNVDKDFICPGFMLCIFIILFCKKI